jgi:DNA repair exonuclease SbcCD ATPase subunit
MMLPLHLMSVRLQGFGAFDLDTTVDLSVAPGLYLISGKNKRDAGLGSNGSGKSTLWDAVCWCLYGVSASGLKAPDLHSWNSDRALFVEVVFDSVTLRREWSPNKLLANGVEVENFLAYTPLTYVGFMSAVLFGQDTGSFLDLCHQDKTQFISEALNLETWNQLSDLAAKRSLLLKKDIVLIDSRLSEVRGALQSLTTSELEQERDSWESSHKEVLRLARRDALDVQVDLKETGALFRESSSLLQSTSQDAQQAAIAFDRSKGVVSLQQSMNSVHSQAVDLMRSNLAAKEQQLEDLGSIKRCPCCGMFLTEKYRLKSIDRFQVELESDRARLALAVENAKFGEDRLGEVREECDACNRSLLDSEQTLRDVRNHHRDVEHILQDLEKSYAVLESRVVSLESEENPYYAQIREVQSRRRSYQKESLALGRLRTDTKAEQSSVEFWVQGFRDIRLQLIEDVLHHLSIVTTGKMEGLGMVGWTIRYKIDSVTKGGTLKKGFSVQVKSPHSPDFVPWESWSGGERQRIRIATTLALSEVLLAAAGVEFDFELWDEPSTYITEEGFEEFLEILQTRATDLGRRIFLTDHRQLDSGKFDGNLRITKSANSTSAVWIS